MKFAYVAAAALFTAAPASAAWHEARSTHFTVYADEEPAALKAYAERLERFDSAVREARGVPDVKPGAASRVTLYLVRDIQQLERVFGERDSGVAGFYIPRASGSVAFVPEKSGRTGAFRLNPQNIFYHEYTHHLMLQDSDRPLPMWLTEGFAEFFASPEFKADGSVVIGMPPRYRANILYEKGYQMPLQQMLSGDFNRITEGEYLSLYGRGWLLTHLLSFDLKRRGQLTRYLNDIQSGVPAAKAADNAFGDIKQLDRELDAYFKRQTFTVSTIPASKIRVGPIALRELRPGEAKMMWISIMLARGGSELKAKELARQARGIARDFPNDPAVLTTLSRIELEADRPQPAAEAADQALRLAPQSDQAMLAKARAMIALGKAAPASVNWENVRMLISRANRLDPENAEPLRLFYATYVSQGVQPSKNALSGLKYAVVLAPQDDKLRMDLVGQLIDRSDFDEARRFLVPLAFSPYQGKRQDAVVELFEQVTAKNQAMAKAKWQAAAKFFKDDD